MRARALELAALASRAAIEGGAGADSIYELSQAYLAQLERAKDRESLCRLLQDALEGFMRARFGPAEGAGAHIRRALRYMGDHYSKPLTLDAVADAVSLSPNYLSLLFRKQLHCTFREQLCRIRVEESKSLLLNTEYSLADIALAMGFADQSYYCKSFKRIVGIPPGRFRQSV